MAWHLIITVGHDKRTYLQRQESPYLASGPSAMQKNDLAGSIERAHFLRSWNRPLTCQVVHVLEASCRVVREPRCESRRA
jgi:hypothetical protein